MAFAPSVQRSGAKHIDITPKRIKRLRKVCGAAVHIVRAGQSVAGAQAFGAERGMSAPGAWDMGTKCAQNTYRQTGQVPMRSGQHAQPRSMLICADLP